MTIIVLTILIISFILMYVLLNIDKFKLEKVNEYQGLIDKIRTNVAKANGASIDQFSLENSYEYKKKKEDELYKKTDFLNKNCKKIDDFIINNEINEFDLRKLAELNEIQLQISKAWYPLVIQLVKELHIIGWDKKVSCIKEKYAHLEFYTDYKSGSSIYNIIQEFGDKSEYICETCGAKGKIRYNSSWDYVACRKHYLENRGTIIIENAGFNYNDIFYPWKKVKNIILEDFDDYSKKYKFLAIEFDKKIVKHQGWKDEKLYLSKNNIGFGKLLNLISSQSFTSEFFTDELQKNYIKNYENVKFCEICGYEAVYLEQCECCENDVWEEKLEYWEKQIIAYQNREKKNNKMLEFYQEKINNKERLKEKDIKYCQIKWILDDGEIYELKQKNYRKNPHYKILFTENELNEHL